MELAAFSDRGIGTRERLEDYAADRIVTTPGGLQLQIAMVCDGAGGGEAGELAARLTSRTIFEYLEISPETSVPKLLIKAVEEANKAVYSELQGTGTSTVALAAVHLNDGATYGRLYIANVGNSRIYLIRESRLVRLNIDHTLANEYVFAGQMSPEEAKELNDPNYVTRSIGTGAKISVDIGFYAERGRDFVNSRRASRIGQKGMELLEGDTVFAASDGLFPFVQDSEFIEYALDDDVERATRTLLKYAADRRPDDNTALSMLFVPSGARKMVTTAAPRLSTRQRAGVGFFILAVILALIFMALQVSKGQEQQTALLATQQAFQVLATQAAYTDTPLPPSPTATATQPVADGQVGSRFSLSQPNGIQIFAGHFIDPLLPPEINYVNIAGATVLKEGRINNPANLYLQPPSGLNLVNVLDDAGKQHIEVGLNRGSDIFVNLGDYHNGGVSLALVQNPAVSFQSQSSCFAAKQIPADASNAKDTEKVAFTCYGGDNTCSYQMPGQDSQLMTANKRYLLDITNNQLLATDNISQAEIDIYRETIWQLQPQNPNQLNCLLSWLDEDGDKINFPQDQCPADAGSVAARGCPDEDNDGVQNNVDQCLGNPGPAENKGCPIEDVDGDGLGGTGTPDFCPYATGLPENGGCPDENQYNNFLTETAIGPFGIISDGISTPTETPVPLPEAHDDHYGVEKDKQLFIPPPGLLINDNVNFAILQPFTGASSQGGSVVLNGDGGFTYSPAAGYTGLDTFTYTLSGSLGSSSATVNINVLKPPIAPPVAAFIAVPPEGPAPLNVAFTDNSTGVINTRTWDFGDGISSHLIQPSHIYPNPGVYNVTLIVAGPGGTSSATGTVIVTAATPTVTVTVTTTSIVVPTATLVPTATVVPVATATPKPPDPVACFRVNTNTPPVNAKAGTSLTFDATCSQNAAAFNWNFGDTTTGTGSTIQHAFARSGVFTVTLRVTGSGAPPVIRTITGVVNVGPKACFTPKTFTSPPNQSVPFSANCSLTSAAANPTYAWDYGDPPTGTGVNAPHTYVAAGVYNVTMTITDDFGTDNTTGTITVEQPPTACFVPAADTTVFQGQTLGFNANCSQPQATITAYNWTIPAAIPAGDRVQADPLLALTFNTVGVFQICLDVTTTIPSANTPCINVTVNAAAVCDIPVANDDTYHAVTGAAAAGPQITIAAPGVLINDVLSIPGTALTPNNFASPLGGTFAMLINAVNPNRGRLQYTPPSMATAITNGVPAAATTFTDTFVYTLNGPGAGCTDTATVSVIVTLDTEPLNPQFTFTPPGGGLAPLTVNFNASTSTGPITTYTWDFGDGTTATTTSATITHIYATPGAYNVTLTLNGIAAPANTQVVNVTFPLPVACFDPANPYTPANPVVGDVVTFDATCSTNGVDYFWDFGDGNFAFTQTPTTTHTYTVPGFYFVFLQVSNPAGASADFVFIFVNPPPPPNACFTVDGVPPDPPPVVTNTDVTFDATPCAQAGNTYFWDFGDATTLPGQTVTHQYANPGTYFVTLTVTNASGSSFAFAQVTATDPPPIRIPPAAAINVSIVGGSTVSFDSTSTGSINIYDWNLGDGSAHISGSSFTHTFPAIGVYDVTLIVVGPIGADVATVTVDLNATPTPTNTRSPHTPTPTLTLESSQPPPQNNNTPQPPQPTPKPTRRPTVPPPPTEVPPPTDIPVPPPVAVNDEFSVGAGGSISVNISQVLSNDTLNGASSSSIGGASNGSIVQSADDPNVYIYTPNEGFTGTDTATYSLTNAGGSSTATVTFNVN